MAGTESTVGGALRSIGPVTSRFITMMLIRRLAGFNGSSAVVERARRGHQHRASGRLPASSLRRDALARSLDSSVAVAALAADERRGVGGLESVSRFGTSVRICAISCSNSRMCGLQRGAAVEHRPVLLVDDLDAQAVGGRVDLDLRAARMPAGVAASAWTPLRRLQATFSALRLFLQRLQVDRAALGLRCRPAEALAEVASGRCRRL